MGEGREHVTERREEAWKILYLLEGLLKSPLMLLLWRRLPTLMGQGGAGNQGAATSAGQVTVISYTSNAIHSDYISPLFFLHKPYCLY